MGYSVRLRKVGRSIMVAIPPAVLDELKLKQQADVHLTVKAGRLVIEPKTRRRYTMDQLLREGRKARNLKFKDKAWLATRSIGREVT